MSTIDTVLVSAVDRKSNAAVTLADRNEEADLAEVSRSSSTSRHSKRTKDSTDNNAARSKYRISLLASNASSRRSTHRHSRLVEAEAQNSRHRSVKRSLQSADRFSV